MVVDTSIVIDHLRAGDKNATKLVKLAEKYQVLFISAVSVYELYAGATSPFKIEETSSIISNMSVLLFDEDVALKAAEIYRQLKSKNKLIEFRDLFIAATCVVHDYPIATLNKKHFERIDSLIIA